MEEKNSKAAKRRNNKQINCRYGAECRNIGKGCKFVHPPANLGGVANAHASKQNQMKPPSSEKSPSSSKRDKSKIPCRYGMDCLHSKCPYFHHPSAAAAVASSTSSSGAAGIKSNVVSPPPALSTANNGDSTSPPPTPSRKAINKKKCRWGAGCRNKKCAFTHPVHSPRQDGGGSSGGESATKSPMTKSPSAAAAAAYNNLVGEMAYNSANNKTTPTGFRSMDMTPQRTKILFPTLSFSPPHDDDDDDMQEQVASNSKNNDNNHTFFSPPVSNPPGFACHSPLFAMGMVTSNDNSSTPLSSSAAASNINGIKSNIYSYLPNRTSSITTPAAKTTSYDQHQRTPLYAFDSPLPINESTAAAAAVVNNGFTASQYLRPAVVAAVANGGMTDNTFSAVVNYGNDAQNLPIDADWLHEVLGLDGLDMSKPVESQKMHHHHQNDHGMNIKAQTGVGVVETMWENSLAGTPSHQLSTTLSSDVTSMEDRLEINDVEESQEPIDPYDSDEKSEGVILISEDEIGQSRRAALELRLESQQSSHQNADYFFSLLDKCRANQKTVQSALEESMDSNNEDTAGKGLDEDNVMALLELNELLIGAISVAESSGVHNSFVENNRKAGNAKSLDPKSESPLKGSERASPAKNDTAAKGKEKQSKTKKVKKASSNTDTVSNYAPPDKKVPVPVVDKVVTFIDNIEPKIDPVDAAKQEKEKIARLMQEARQQAAAAKEKKKSKKSQKIDKWIKEQEEAKESRAKSWEVKIAKEIDYVDLIQKIIVAEFLRQSKEKTMGLTSDRVLSDTHAAEIIESECREAYHAIFFEQKVRIVVAGSENKELNGRNGTIRYWDKDKKKFCVGLDTKKTTDSDVNFLDPEVLDEAVSYRSGKSEKKKPKGVYDLGVPDLMTYGGVSLGLNFTLTKSYINALGSAENTNIGLEEFCRQRDEEDRQKKLEEEREKARDEEDRKRRAERRAKENAAWEKRKAQMRRDKEEYERMQREWRMGGDDEECGCPRCRFGNKFSSRGGAFFFNIGGIPFRVRFDNYESDEDSFFDEFDERWEEQMRQEKREENRKMAKILGVEPNADERTIKVAYRKLALQFHPDKWRNDSDHGLSRRDSESRFKTIQSAYDHLMSNFDNSDDE